MEKVVIVGATSGIGKYLAELYAKFDSQIAIIGRREDKLKEIAATDSVKYIYKTCDISQIDTLIHVLDEIATRLGGIDLMIITAGTGELNPELLYPLEEETLKTNVLGWTCVVDWTVKQFEKQGFGHLVSISSVGGLRGSGMAPAYNASKAFQINYLEGIRQKVNKITSRISVTDVRPGFVNTAMAKGNGLFWVAPVDKAGKQIYLAIQKQKKIVYITRRWKFVAWILKILPSFLYCKI